MVALFSGLFSDPISNENLSEVEYFERSIMGSKQEKRDGGRLVGYSIEKFQNLFKIGDKFQPR